MDENTQVAHDAIAAVTAQTREGYERAASQVSQGIASATAGFAQTQAQMKEQIQTMMKTAEQFVAFTQGNAEALMKSSQIFAAGLQDIGRTVAASMQASVEEQVATFKAVTAVKSPREALDLQAAHTRAAMARSVADGSKIADASVKLAEQALAPITARVTLATEQFGRTA